MDNIHFTDEAIAGLVTESVLMMIIPVVLLIVWKVKTHEKILPVIVGAVTWLLFAIILKLAPAYFLLQHDNPVAKAISGNIWYSAILAGVLAGVFEETGRFIAFKTVLKKYENRRSSVSYGIGHGGFESIYIGFQMFSMAALGMMLNMGMGEQITAGADEAPLSAMTAQLTQMSTLTVPECLLGVFERIPAIASHIAFSVLVFAAARNRKHLYLYPLAILLHALMDFSVVFNQIGLPAWAFELIFTGFALTVGYFASRIYRKLNVR